MYAQCQANRRRNFELPVSSRARNDIRDGGRHTNERRITRIRRELTQIESMLACRAAWLRRLVSPFHRSFRHLEHQSEKESSQNGGCRKETDACGSAETNTSPLTECSDEDGETVEDSIVLPPDSTGPRINVCLMLAAND